MKKNEDAAAKKKPKTSAAQIRVQKGTRAKLTRILLELGASGWDTAAGRALGGKGGTVREEEFGGATTVSRGLLGRQLRSRDPTAHHLPNTARLTDRKSVV